MERFYEGNHVAGSRLIDLNFGAKLKLPKGLSLSTKSHHFKEESSVKNTLGQKIQRI
jgi:hypothetical protein